MVPALSLAFEYDGVKVSRDHTGDSIEIFDDTQLQVIRRHAREEVRDLADIEGIALNYGFGQPSEMFESVQMVGKDEPEFILWSFENGVVGVPPHPSFTVA